tara:strand:- start:292 stop:528 length:237 start_codon:yes stop_codon:yes gene_type:complete
MNSKLFEKQIISLISKILNLKVSQLNQKSSAKNIKNWDSMNHVKIIVGLEKEFKVKINTSVAMELDSIKKIVNFINRR